MTAKTRLKRLEAAHRSRSDGGFIIGVQGDDMPEGREIDYRDCIADLAPRDLVRVGDKVMTLAEWDSLEGQKILITRLEEEEVKHDW